MAEIKEVHQITSLPGIRRDGTQLDGDFFTGGQWTRFMRGRPKKMGGYQEITTPVPGPIRAVQVWSRNQLNAIISASQFGITQSNVDENGGAGTSYDRTPAIFDDFDGCWTIDSMYDDAVGSQGTIFLAHRNNALGNIDEATNYPVYYGLASDTAAFQPISGLEVSGGIVTVHPYLVYYGSDGLVGWSDANQPQTLVGGDAGSDRVTGAKVVKGLPLRSGSGPAALLWSLDSVLRMDYIGGNAIFRFSTISSSSSIMAQNSVIEYDGDYYWIGIDKFMAYAGGKVQELPNLMNKNWFFDNVNFAHRQKIWATKVPRFGEIIWFFPFGDSTECNKAVVFNINEKTWYDFESSRTAGYYSQVFQYPVWAGDSSNFAIRLDIGTLSGSFTEGEILIGSTTGAKALILQVENSGNSLLVQDITNPSARPTPFEVNEEIRNAEGTVTAAITRIIPICSNYVHEKGSNRVTATGEEAIEAYFDTADFGYPTGGAQQNDIKGLNRWTRLIRIEPDFLMDGEMTVRVIGREFAQSTDTISAPFTFNPDTDKIDMREQRRQIRLRFTSNTLNGNFEMGRVILHTEPGDVRS
jgi:hypothetical protein